MPTPESKSDPSNILGVLPLNRLDVEGMNARRLEGGQKIVIFLIDGDYKVFESTCPHMGADLEEGRYCKAEGALHCFWHGYVFGLDDGKFLDNPNVAFMGPIRKKSKHFDPDKVPDYRLKAFPCRVEEGKLVVLQRGGAQ